MPDTPAMCAGGALTWPQSKQGGIQDGEPAKPKMLLPFVLALITSLGAVTFGYALGCVGLQPCHIAHVRTRGDICVSRTERQLRLRARGFGVTVRQEYGCV